LGDGFAGAAASAVPVVVAMVAAAAVSSRSRRCMGMAPGIEWQDHEGCSDAIQLRHR